MRGRPRPNEQAAGRPGRRARPGRSPPGTGRTAPPAAPARRRPAAARCRPAACRAPGRARRRDRFRRAGSGYRGRGRRPPPARRPGCDQPCPGRSGCSRPTAAACPARSRAGRDRRPPERSARTPSRRRSSSRSRAAAAAAAGDRSSAAAPGAYGCRRAQPAASRGPLPGIPCPEPSSCLPWAPIIARTGVIPRLEHVLVLD